MSTFYYCNFQTAAIEQRWFVSTCITINILSTPQIISAQYFVHLFRAKRTRVHPCQIRWKNHAREITYLFRWARFTIYHWFESSHLCYSHHHHHHHITTVLWPFFRDHPGEPVPEENFWTVWCKGRFTEADTLTVRVGATPSGLTSAHLHHPPYLCYSQTSEISVSYHHSS